MLQRIFLFFLLLMGNFAFAVENVNFISKPLTAGKASLTENGFLYTRFSWFIILPGKKRGLSVLLGPRRSWNPLHITIRTESFGQLLGAKR